MAELQFPNIAGNYQQGLGFGRQMRAEDEARRNQSRLSELAAQAYGSSGQDRQNAIQQAIGVDPQAGFAIDQQMGQQDAAREKRLLSNARLLASAPEPYKAALYRQIYPQVAQDLPGLPPEWTPEVAQGIEAFIASRSPGGGNLSERFRVVGSSLVDLKDPSKPVFTAPEATRTILTDQGLVRVGPGGVEELRLGGEQEAPAELQPQQDFAALGQQFGLTPTSVLRSPEKNAEVDGVPNSFHLTGQASDWVVPPDQKPAFIRAAQQRGYQAIDEGDHVHIEPPGSPRAPTGGRRLGPAISASQQQQMELSRESAARDQRRLELAEQSAAREAASAAARGAVGKALTQGTVDKLTKEAGRLDILDNLSASFQPDYAAGGGLGDIENLAGRVGGERFGVSTPGQAEWWQKYDRFKNEVRNELFGASLTTSEQQAFKSADITPNMDPAVIQANLKAQTDVIRGALERRAKTWAAQGYNKEAIRVATGIELEDGQGAPREVRTQAEYDALPSGAIYLEDGQQYRKP